MTDATSQLAWLGAQQDAMTALVIELASINSGSFNLEGLTTVEARLRDVFAPLGAPIESLEVEPLISIDAAGQPVHTPLGRALRIRKREDAARRVFLGIHMDTVFAPAHPFQNVTRIDDDTLRGPGVADAKGGLVVMLFALLAFERSPFAEQLGWEVLINPDEEIGSPGSLPLLREAAGRNDVGLVYEPALADGSLAAPRKGSGNFTLVVRGRAAHVGRHFDDGRNAIHMLADTIGQLSAINAKIDGATLSIGKVEGGGPVNIVPDLAIARFNVRVLDAAGQQAVEEHIERVVARVNEIDGYSAEVHGRFYSPPKPIDAPMRAVMDEVEMCASQLGIDVRWQATGGVCDGNKLAAAGLPNVDTLGPRGGGLHSDGEFVVVKSLSERAKLSALMLMRYAAGEGKWPVRESG